jgi:hypothetical protein
MFIRDDSDHIYLDSFKCNEENSFILYIVIVILMYYVHTFALIAIHLISEEGWWADTFTWLHTFLIRRAITIIDTLNTTR